MSEYPNYPAWVAIIAQRDAGFVFVGVLTVIAAAWLINARFLWGKWLPLIRSSLLVVFYITACLSVVTKLLGAW